MTAAVPPQPALRAGQTVMCREHGTAGRIGFIASTRAGVIALTTQPVVPVGNPGRVAYSAGMLALGEARALIGATTPHGGAAWSMLVALPVPTTCRAAAAFLGLEAARGFVSPHTAIGEGLFLADTSGPRYIGRLAAVDASIRRAGTAPNVRLFGAAEVALADPEAIGRGDAGAAIGTEDGRILGIIVGRREGRAVVAPCAPLGEALSLVPLTAFAASRHENAYNEALAREEMRRQREEERRASRDASPDLEPAYANTSSSEIMARHGKLLELV